jgi:hypothetical protein
MRGPVVIDRRNAFDPHAMREAGMFYYPIGRLTAAVVADHRAAA